MSVFQFITKTIKSEVESDEIVVKLNYHAINKAYVSFIQLVEGEEFEKYTFDENENIKTIKKGNEVKEYFYDFKKKLYREKNDFLKINNIYSYAPNDKVAFKEDLYKNKITYEYDQNNDVKKETIKTIDNYSILETSIVSYIGDKKQIVNNGKETFLLNKKELVENYNFKNKLIIENEYNAKNLVETKKFKKSETKSISNTFSYNNYDLLELKNSNTFDKYNYEYDEIKNISKVKYQNNTIEEYSYLTKVKNNKTYYTDLMNLRKYSDNSITSYIYDENNNIKEIKEDAILKTQTRYNANNQITNVYNHENHIETNLIYENKGLLKNIQTIKYDSNKSILDYYEVKYNYDSNKNAVKEIIETKDNLIEFDVYNCKSADFIDKQMKLVKIKLDDMTINFGGCSLLKSNQFVSHDNFIYDNEFVGQTRGKLQINKHYITYDLQQINNNRTIAERHVWNQNFSRNKTIYIWFKIVKFYNGNSDILCTVMGTDNRFITVSISDYNTLTVEIDANSIETGLIKENVFNLVAINIDQDNGSLSVSLNDEIYSAMDIMGAYDSSFYELKMGNGLSDNQIKNIEVDLALVGFSIDPINEEFIKTRYYDFFVEVQNITKKSISFIQNDTISKKYETINFKGNLGTSKNRSPLGYELVGYDKDQYIDQGIKIGSKHFKNIKYKFDFDVSAGIYIDFQKNIAYANQNLFAFKNSANMVEVYFNNDIIYLKINHSNYQIENINSNLSYKIIVNISLNSVKLYLNSALKKNIPISLGKLENFIIGENNTNLYIASIKKIIIKENEEFSNEEITQLQNNQSYDIVMTDKYDEVENLVCEELNFKDQKLLNYYEYNKNGSKDTININKFKNYLGETFTFRYDDFNNLININNVEKYCYDNYSRLVKDLSQQKEYFYDDFGNITKILENQNETNFIYTNSLLTKVTYLKNGVLTEENITYNGFYVNKINDKNMVYSHNKLRRIYSNDLEISYKYNENGIRIEKEVNGVKISYQVKGNKIICEKKGDHKTYYLYKKEELIGLYYQNENYFYVRGLTGIIEKIIDEDKNIIVSYTYDAYGNVLNSVGFGVKGNTIKDINNYLYKGYYYDQETKFYYCDNRYYDSMKRGKTQNVDISTFFLFLCLKNSGRSPLNVGMLNIS